MSSLTKTARSQNVLKGMKEAIKGAEKRVTELRGSGFAKRFRKFMSSDTKTARNNAMGPHLRMKEKVRALGKDGLNGKTPKQLKAEAREIRNHAPRQSDIPAQQSQARLRSTSTVNYNNEATNSKMPWLSRFTNGMSLRDKAALKARRRDKRSLLKKV